MKKVLTLALAAILAFGCIGCGSEDDSALLTEEPAMEIADEDGAYITDDLVPLAPLPGEEATDVPEEEPVEVHKYVLEIVELVNKERAKEGLAPLELDMTLTAAAQVRAEEAKKSFSHTRPNGERCFTALSDAGITYKTAGENLGGRIKTPSRAVTLWMGSKGHRANIMNPQFKYIGVGYVASGNYWSQFFTG